MHSFRSVLLERINIAISKKWFRKADEIINSSSISERKTDRAGKSEAAPFAGSRNANLIGQLERRIETLENQNDQLLYFVNFLVENLPDLILTTLQDEWEGRTNISCEEEDAIDSSSMHSCYRKGKDTPCPTRREKDVLELLSKGLCAKEIANKLYISETTVVTHKKNLKDKFNARNTVELISKAQSYLSKQGKI